MKMKEKQLLLQYKKDVNNLVECATDLNLPESKIKGVFFDCFNLLKHEAQNVSSCENSNAPSNKFCSFIIRCIRASTLVFSLAIFIYILLNVHQPTSSLVLRNVQGLIYPGLKILRFLSVPVIKRFPSLTGFYDETCLFENPYFYVHDMECWPCQNVYSVVELTGTNNQSMYQSGMPHVTKTSHQTVPFKSLKTFYKQNKVILDKESNSIKSTSYKMNELKDIFSQNSEKLDLSDVHVSWRINRMSPARIVRRLFPRPESLSPRSGQSVERFIIIDGAKAPPYSLPSTECSYISLKQASGQRTIVLKPSLECSRQCHTLSIILQPSDILWYNWWYWRPVSLPVENATEASVSYISSYC